MATSPLQPPQVGSLVNSSIYLNFLKLLYNAFVGPVIPQGPMWDLDPTTLLIIQSILLMIVSGSTARHC